MSTPQQIASVLRRAAEWQSGSGDEVSGWFGDINAVKSISQGFPARNVIRELDMLYSGHPGPISVGWANADHITYALLLAAEAVEQGDAP